MKRVLLMVCGLLLVVPAARASATLVKLTMDELPSQPVNGLSFKGVTFGFTVGGVPSTDATYNAFNGGQLTFVQDPALEGDAAGVLTLDFTTPTPILNFGVALSTFEALSPGCSVELFDNHLASLGTTGVDTAPLIAFTEGRFTYSGTPVRRAVITFNSNAAGRFAIDNLTFVAAAGAAAPAVGPSALLGLALLLLGFGVTRLRSSPAR